MPPIMRKLIKNALGLDGIDQIYENIGYCGEGSIFLNNLLDILNISFHIDNQAISLIPSQGPVIVVANHPFGGIEGVILAAMLKSVRNDVKLMANFLLQRIPELRDIFIYVDPYGRSDSVKNNIRPLKDALAWLHDGGMLGVFPAGAVSHVQWRERAIADPAWNNNCARLIRKTGATVVPVFFHGVNGPWFQILGLVHPCFRTMLLPHEFMNKKGRAVQLTIGNAIPFEKLRSFASDAEMMTYLRLRTYILKARRDQGQNSGRKVVLRGRLKSAERPLAPFRDGQRIIQEVRSLPSESILLESGDFMVCLARARQIPCLLKEIGRLRELTFRRAHEGTGKASDLDIFDWHYLHLFIWNRAKHEVVGAYRLGQADYILERLGKSGLYTSTLFKYKTALLQRINPALELGRSFVRAEYQKNYAALLLLWKGIGSFVARNPRYKILFGPVSINNQYHTISQQLMVNSLKLNNYLPELGKLVKPKRHFQSKILRHFDGSITNAAISDINEVSDLIADIEPNQQGIPILLKQYLKLGGKLLAFNQDQNFSNVLDALILVDLTETPLKIMERYMGRDGARTFITYHDFPSSVHQADTMASSANMG
ncbi:MAG: lysophospholipid acyltransferase family protein [Desulfobaccales bacterium]